MAIITVFSGAFCRADEITTAVAEELGYPFIDDKLVEQTSQRYGVPSDKLQRALTGPEPFLDKFTHGREKGVAYLRIVLSELIQSDNVMVRGCAGHLIPRTISHVLRTCIIANHAFRVEQAVQETGKSSKEAARLVHEADKRQFACTEYLFDKPAYDESLYDIVLPMHDRTVAEAARIIREHALGEPLQTTERSRRAASDFVLSANVHLALVQTGLAADVHSEDGQVILSIMDDVVRLGRYRERLIEAAEKVPGVKGVSTRLGPRYRAKSVNPWANIEGPPKIMLVDDEKEFVHTLSERLRTRNLESSIAYDGEQALDMLQKEVPDVIVLDLMMPGIDGIETLRRIKRDHPRVEVIILTGHGSEREKQMAEELGAFAYLSKPVDIDVLARVMRDAYKRTGPGRSAKASGEAADGSDAGEQ